MNRKLFRRRAILTLGFIFYSLTWFYSVVAGADAPLLNPAAPNRLPLTFEGKALPPELGCFWSYADDDAKLRDFVDAVGPSCAFNALVLTTRSLNHIVDNEAAVERTRRAVEYAKTRFGIDALLDIDLRIARYDFEKARPDLDQERLLFQEQSLQLSETEETIFHFQAPVLNDHYTGNNPYFVRGGRFVKAWAYRVNEAQELLPETIEDVSEIARFQNDNFVSNASSVDEVDATVIDRFDVSFPNAALVSLAESDYRIAVAVAFKYSYPDLFADETLELEQKLYQTYSVVPAIGVCKDEWGFPPNFTRVDRLDDFWFSERMRTAYAKRYDGRDLVDDLFLAFKPVQDSNSDRVAAVDRFRSLCFERVVEYEKQNYELTKRFWGEDAFVGVHCTWFPWPNLLELRKNGMMWWKAPRDFAQTDEYVPFCVRNSLAKGCGSLWINMFYASDAEKYVWEHWTSAASGGRVHVHQIYPRTETSPTNEREPKMTPIIKDNRVDQIRAKIRLLSLASNAPIDSSVAVVFSRYGASNPLRQEFLAVGVDVCDMFSSRGYPADLIPIDEVFSVYSKGEKRWSVQDSYLRYGEQKYRAVILFGESDCERSAYDELKRLVESCPDACKTRIVHMEASATEDEKESVASEIIALLEKDGVPTQTPWARDEYSFSTTEESSCRPPRRSVSRFLDGLILWIAASEDKMGDPIVLNNERVPLNEGGTSPSISAEARGVFAVKFDAAGRLVALVAAGLKSVKVDDELDFALTESEIGNDTVDVVLLRNDDGSWRGIFQRDRNSLPESLRATTDNWRFLMRSDCVPEER